MRLRVQRQLLLTKDSDDSVTRIAKARRVTAAARARRSCKSRIRSQANSVFLVVNLILALGLFNSGLCNCKSLKGPFCFGGDGAAFCYLTKPSLPTSTARLFFFQLQQ
jgi:hypothetical protein